MTRICVTLVGPALSTVIEQGVAAAEQGANLVEVRLDLMHGTERPEKVLEQLAAVKYRFTVPIIVTYRSMLEGGQGPADDAARVAVLERAIELGFDAVDFEWSIADPLRARVMRQARANGVTTIGSRHVREAPQAPGEVLAWLEEGLAAAPDIVKLVVATPTLAAAGAVVSAARIAHACGYRFVVMGTGRHGHLTRILAPVLGAELIYASLKPGLRLDEAQVTLQTVLAFWTALGWR